jgi:S-DNA-T family DNA segregation ATPase FtsK/SpoIIIE
LLIAGSSGAGKSVEVHSILLDLLRRKTADNLKLILVDLQMLELAQYEGIPHLLTPVIVDTEKCISALKWAAAETGRRLKLLTQTGSRNIYTYNDAHPADGMPDILIVVESMTELMHSYPDEFEPLLNTIARSGRITGIHLILVTNRPTVDIISGLLKTYIPARIAFHAVSGMDSRIILDRGGAEKISKKGELLFVSPDNLNPVHLQADPLDMDEVTVLVKSLRHAGSQFNDEVRAQVVTLGGRGAAMATNDDADDMFDEAAAAVFAAGKASASMLQRRLRVGYARAARLLDLLEERGVIGAADGARPRDILITSLDQIRDES